VFRRALAKGLLFAALLPVPSALPAYAASYAPAPPAARSASAQEQVKDEWMGMYLGPRKIGYTSLHTEPTTYQGKPALSTVSKLRTQLTVLGATVEQDEADTTITDTQYRPLYQNFNVRSNGSVVALEAHYDYAAHKIDCLIGTGDARTKKTIAIPPGANLAGDTNALTNGKALTVGQKMSFLYLEPLSVELQPVSLEVVGRENVPDAVLGKSIPAFVVKTNMAVGAMTTWEADNGDTLKGEMDLAGLRLTLIKQTQQAALDADAPLPAASVSAGDKNYTPPADFAVATAIAPDKPIENPRRLRSLRVTISGIPNKRLILSDRRQEAVQTSDDSAADMTVRMSVQAEPFSAAQSARLPVTNPDLLPYLKSAPYLDSDNAAIRATAARLRKDDTNLYRIACAIRDWVHNAMTPDASIGVPRSAGDIFTRRRGVCRDYATLYTALARAAGVPTRIVSGIVYADGKFYYHAWAESWVGQWIAFDPTLYDPQNGPDYVDATHIKFAQGDVTSMFNVVEIVGKLHIAVQDSAG
jgi:hypothetical protein